MPSVVAPIVVLQPDHEAQSFFRQTNLTPFYHLSMDQQVILYYAHANENYHDLSDPFQTENGCTVLTNHR
jgi:hypothetical protein